MQIQQEQTIEESKKEGSTMQRKHQVRLICLIVGKYGWDLITWWPRKLIERKKERALRTELNRRRDEANTRARIIFDNLELGLPLPAYQIKSTMDDEPLQATIWLDEPQAEQVDMIGICCLPIIETPFRTYGLLLRSTQDPNKHYARLGIFKLNSSELNKLPRPISMETFILV